tara:strand:- start:1606 stop:2226 length:621 start_codon:yes stop_codon:yes gene_type:complete
MSSDVNKLLSKEEVLLNSLYEFYKNKSNIDKILPIVTGNSDISLRVLDYFVTNYSKYNNISIKKNNLSYNVYQDYKNKLKSYNKRFFDPFCRINKKNSTNKIAFKYENDKCIITTIGQLNFFRWAIRNNIIDYVIEDHNKINEEMNKINNSKKKYKLKNNLINRNINKNEEYIINTTVTFGNTKRKYKVKASNINDDNFNITKLEF